MQLTLAGFTNAFHGISLCALGAGARQLVVCAEDLIPSMVVMQSTQDWTCSYEADPLDRV